MGMCAELTSLRALNVSGTRVGDGLVEFLTYGSRLHSWASQQEETRVEDLKLVTEACQYGVQTLMSQYPVSNLTYLRLQRTHITHAAIAHLLGERHSRTLSMQVNLLPYISNRVGYIYDKCRN